MNHQHPKLDKAFVYKELATNYDNQIEKYDSYGRDLLFGMSFEFVEAGEKLLDVGIGAGLSSVKFSQLGLQVYGLDSSQEMLNACQTKSFIKAISLCLLYTSPSPRDPE